MNTMNKKAAVPLLLIIILGSILLAGVGYYVVKNYIPQQQTSFSSSQCVMIKNSNDPNLPYTETTSSSTVTCSNASECVVYGSMTVTSPNINYLWSCPGGLGTSCSRPRSFNNQSSCESTTNWCSSYSMTKVCPVKCISSGTNQDIQAFWNFNVVNNFPYSNTGSSNSVIVNIPTLLYTSESPVIKSDVSFTFAPKYADNSDVIDKVTYIRKADCTCADPTNYCVAGTKKCLACPTGYIYGQGNYMCPAGMQSNVCYKGNNYYKDECIPAFIYYEECTSTHLVGSYGGSCKWWNEASYKTCDNGTKCYSGNSGTTTINNVIGDCRCSQDNCSEGDLKNDPADPHRFFKCEKQVTGCKAWNPTAYTCASGLTFSLSQKSCICDTSLLSYCGGKTSECSNSLTQTRTCNQNPAPIYDNQFGNVPRICATWSNYVDCPSPQQCNVATNKCDCSNSYNNKCTLGTIKCDGINKYFSCVNNVCPVWSLTSSLLNESINCIDSQLTSKTGCKWQNPKCSSGVCIIDSNHPDGYCENNLGCKFLNIPNTTYYNNNFACNSSVDENGEALETCSNDNTCTIVTSSFNASDRSSEYQTLNPPSRCISNSIYIMKKYITKNNNIYRWIKQTDCSGSTPVCQD